MKRLKGQGRAWQFSVVSACVCEDVLRVLAHLYFGVQGASEDAVAAIGAPGPDDPQPLSEEELAEKEELLSSGFSNWNRRDFSAFTRACEKVGAADRVSVMVETLPNPNLCSRASPAAHERFRMASLMGWPPTYKVV